MSSSYKKVFLAAVASTAVVLAGCSDSSGGGGGNNQEATVDSENAKGLVLSGVEAIEANNKKMRLRVSSTSSHP